MHARPMTAALVSILLVAAAGCGGGFRGRGRTIVEGRPAFDAVDPTGTWIVEGSLPWGTGHTLEVTGPGPVFHVVRRDASGAPFAHGVGIAEAGHLFVSYSASLENTQLAVYRAAPTSIEGVWAHGQTADLGTEEWAGLGSAESPFAGRFRTYGTNPDNHGVYRQQVGVTPRDGGYFDVRWLSGNQEFVGLGIRVGDRFAVASILAAQASGFRVYFDDSGYAIASYDLATGQGQALVHGRASDPVTGGAESIRRPDAVPAPTSGGEAPAGGPVAAPPS